MKKPTSDKRATLPLGYEYAAAFKKDWTRLERTGRYDMPRSKAVMMLLIANDGPLGPEWKDHPLTGDWKDCRDCHVHGDFLLIYRIEGEPWCLSEPERTQTYSSNFHGPELRTPVLGSTGVKERRPTQSLKFPPHFIRAYR